MKKTYTTNEVEDRLIISRSTLHRYRRRYKTAFIVIEQGCGRFRPTRYDATAIDHFRKFLKLRQSVFRTEYAP